MMPPFPGIPGIVMSSKPTIPLQTSIEKSTLGPPFECLFQGFSRKGPQRTPGPQRTIKDGQRVTKGTPKGAKGCQREPKVRQQGAQWRPRVSQRSPWHPKGSSKEAYIHKNFRSTAPAAVMLCYCVFNFSLCFSFLFCPYARYGGLKGCGILVHAQLSFWGQGKQLL